MKILKNICIFLAVLFIGFGQAHAAKNTDNGSIQKNINKYILEIYKFQWNKIIQDLDESLTKVAPTKKAKTQAYENIQDTLTYKRKNIEEDPNIGINSKIILTKYLSFMISEIENKKEALE